MITPYLVAVSWVLVSMLCPEENYVFINAYHKIAHTRECTLR
jgi:hypothetical protein